MQSEKFLTDEERERIIQNILDNYKDLDTTELLIKLKNADDTKICNINDLVIVCDESIEFITSLL